ncbi:hypothetical protein [Tateyamaria sp. ANG-S1]|uniref:hypothetical protein n=1 Tax=Tateyamaria sp. ANG-S1 TaxID=1577905 RepID=UPI00057E445F|nr:hypothetical protein [Tateyamaria sp. ANG-S1]KIC48203.1 hypothetical protein RA29_16760 [Tateyamaria sp. ANG-S1]
MAEDYSFSKNATDAETLFARNTFDCVVTIVDPSNEDSFKQLRRVVNAARNGGVPVVTTAEFNPDWIDNLVSQFGSTAHFREFPTTAQLDEFTRSFSAERRAAMERTSI